LYGAGYNPEQWPESVWERDADLMRDAGVTMVTVGMSSWARLQPAEDAWDFDWLDRLMDLFHSRRIAVALATATASPPAWFVHQHPETLPVTADGVRLEFSSRQHGCLSSRLYEAAVTRLTRTIAERYADHPALALWYIHNEHGGEPTQCFCDESANDFRLYLRGRHSHDITELNLAWAQNYTDFDQIKPPREASGSVSPGHLLDWRRFNSRAVYLHYRSERDVLEEVTPDIPVTTNFTAMKTEVDQWAWLGMDDVISTNPGPDPADATDHISAAMDYDLMRSVGDAKPWLLMEQAPSVLAGRAANVPRNVPQTVPQTTEQRRLRTLHAVARGADGIIHPQWRAARSGAEKFHSALLPHAGTGTRGWQQTVRIGEELGRLTEIAGTQIESRVAIVLDWNSWWALESEADPSARIRLREQIQNWYSVLYRWNHTVDFVAPNFDLSSYKVALVPNLFAVSIEDAGNLAEFVEGGGYLVVGCCSGIVDESGHLHQSTDGSGGGYPGPLKEVLGVAVDEWWPLPDGRSTEVSFTADEETAKAHKKAGYSYQPKPAARRWSEWIGTTTAQPVAHYTEGPLAGRPAVTRNEFGQGRAWYVSCDLGPAIEKVLGEAVRPAVVWPSLSSTLAFTGVEVVCRSSAWNDYYFLLNHGDAAVELGSSVPFGAVNLLTGSRPVSLAAKGVAVLKVAKPAA
jgi:beta-galactosidase